MYVAKIPCYRKLNIEAMLRLVEYGRRILCIANPDWQAFVGIAWKIKTVILSLHIFFPSCSSKDRIPTLIHSKIPTVEIRCR